MKLNYTDPNPFVLPSTKFSYVPVDARYLEEIMYNINLIRGNQNKSLLTFNIYDQFGRIKGTFQPSNARSVLNETTLAAFILYIEDLKEAIESIIEEPDSLKSHFGRCFNAPHHKPLSFISQGLLNEMPGLKSSLEERNLPFLTFPDNISGETMHGSYHNFDYSLPQTNDPLRPIFIDAFSKAKAKLQNGIPMFDRMQAGEWPVTKDELSVILGMSIYSKCPTNMPEQNSNYNDESDRYKLTDHKRMSWAMCSFVIQMLRFQPISYEDFSDASSSISNRWFSGAWIAFRAHCSSFWMHSSVFNMNHFKKSGEWLIRGKVGVPNERDGIIMMASPPTYSTGMYWFNFDRMIEKNLMPGGAGMAGLISSWVTRGSAQSPSYNYNWIFHKFQTFDVETDEEAPKDGFTGFRCNVSCFEDNTRGSVAWCSGADAFYYILPTPLGYKYDDQGNAYTFYPGNTFDTSSKVCIHGAPIKRFNLYNAFKEMGVTMNPTTNFLTDIHFIVWDRDSIVSEGCTSISSVRTDGYSLKIKSVSLIDDMIHKPEEFLE